MRIGVVERHRITIVYCDSRIIACLIDDVCADAEGQQILEDNWRVEVQLSLHNPQATENNYLMKYKSKIGDKVGKKKRAKESVMRRKDVCTLRNSWFA